MRIAVTGGAGFIGSHTVTLLLEAGHDVLIIDSFANAERDVPERVASIAGRAAEVLEADITRPESYRDRFCAFTPEAVIHFAGLKAVGESTENPLEYYRVNVGGSITLFREMAAAGCQRLVFSSSATVYGHPEVIPIPETHPCQPMNPYGASKHMVEQIIADWGHAEAGLSAISLRYFNPVGAHPSALIGEAPRGVPNNLMPFVADVAIGKRDCLQVFGQDWDTPDGTGVRDYIHVMELAGAHLAALEATGRSNGTDAINIGTGQGYSVLEIVEAFRVASGREVPYRITDRRPGDPATVVADPSRAAEELGWHARMGLDAMCRDAWAWRQRQDG